jgi:hypothetical protein
MLLDFAKYSLGFILGDFFTKESGHHDACSSIFRGMQTLHRHARQSLKRNFQEFFISV